MNFRLSSQEARYVVGSQLLAMCERIISDDKLDLQKIKDLKTFLDRNKDNPDVRAIRHLHAMMTRITADKVIDRAEQEEFIVTLKNIFPVTARPKKPVVNVEPPPLQAHGSKDSVAMQEKNRGMISEALGKAEADRLHAEQKLRVEKEKLIDAWYYINHSGKRIGPHSIDQIKQFLRQGSIFNDTLVWKTGMRWAAVRSIPDLEPAAALQEVRQALPPTLSEDTHEEQRYNVEAALNAGDTKLQLLIRVPGNKELAVSILLGLLGWVFAIYGPKGQIGFGVYLGFSLVGIILGIIGNSKTKVRFFSYLVIGFSSAILGYLVSGLFLGEYFIK